MDAAATNASAPLSEAQISEYWREGYLIVRGLVDPAACTRAVDAVTKGDLAGWGSDRKDWSARIFEHEKPDGDPTLHNLLVHPQVIGAVEQLMEAPARVFYGMMAIAQPHGGRGLKWHQDNQYTQILGKALNTFIACCTITPEKCNLWVAPRSHLLGVQPHIGGDGHKEAADPGNGICLPTLHPGDACIFTRSTLHRSLTNETGEPRFAYAAQYQEDSARDARTGEKDPLRMRARDLAARWAQRTAAAS